MNIEITKATIDDLSLLYKMQIESFKILLDKYKDFDINPGNESLDRIMEKYNQRFTTYWMIKYGGKEVGGVRVITGGHGRYRISPVFIIPSQQGKGIAQEVFRLLEEFYVDSKVWLLDTILEEKGHCYLYEKLGYKKTGKPEKIKEGMTIVYYEKQM